MARSDIFTAEKTADDRLRLALIGKKDRDLARARRNRIEHRQLTPTRTAPCRPQVDHEGPATEAIEWKRRAGRGCQVEMIGERAVGHGRDQRLKREPEATRNSQRSPACRQRA